ncbi:MAG: ParB/RepB/Spo0J family partition protein [Deltaproteobacteria bacterium]|nr:ParB/RepB/Spo0J family partition protein [Deltaproteobacteria bacterium]
MAERQALGRGLEALFPEVGLEDRPVIMGCPIEQVVPNRFQPRRRFDPERLRELAESVKSAGVVEPLIVRRATEGYELIAGERRWRAAQLAGLAEVPVVVREVSDREALQLTLVENVQREDLNALELAEAYQRLLTEFELTQEALAAWLGKDRATIANHLRLLKLPREVKDALIEGRITMGHARALLALESPGRQREALAEILRRDLSVRGAEQLVQRLRPPGALVRPVPRRDPNLRAAEESLRRALGTKVRIKGRAGRGTIEIAYYSAPELQRLIELLRGAR